MFAHVQVEYRARLSISNGITLPTTLLHQAVLFQYSLVIMIRQMSLQRLIEFSYSLFAFFRVGSLSWISLPTHRHQLLPGRRRCKAFVVMLWTTAFVHNKIAKLCQRFKLDASKGRLPIPHLPQHNAQAVDICTEFVYLGTKHLRCYVNRSSCRIACYVNGMFEYTNVREPHSVVL